MTVMSAGPLLIYSFPVANRHGCETQLNLASPQALTHGLRNSRRRPFLMGCEVFWCHILLEVLGINYDYSDVFSDVFAFHYI